MYTIINNIEEEQLVLDVLDTAGFKWIDGDEPREFSPISDSKQVSYILYMSSWDELTWVDIGFNVKDDKFISIQDLITKYTK